MKSVGSNSTMSSRVASKSSIVCRCGFECPIWTSQKLKSKGRRFFGCPLYKDQDKYCGFFQWYDEDNKSGAMNSSIPNVQNENFLSMKVAMLEAKIGELEAVKNLELGGLQVQLKMKNECIKQLEVQLKAMKILLFVIVFGFVIKLFT